MKKFRVIIILLLVFAIGFVSWSFYSKKSLDQIKQHATMVKIENVKNTFLTGRYLI